MTRPEVLILRAPGTNCDEETAFAFELAGARATRVHVNRLLQEPQPLDRAQILCIPGGFSYGDDIAAGRILAQHLRRHLADALRAFCDAGKILLGICNGFQALLQSGLLIGGNSGDRAGVTLTLNDSGRYEDRWVHLAVDSHRCVMLRGIDAMYLPVAHAEGKFVVRDQAILDQLRNNHQIALAYRAPPHTPVSDSVPYPANPNGSIGNVAGLCDETGRVLGLMPHPERYVHRTQHPRWTREELPEEGEGLRLFRNAVGFFS